MYREANFGDVAFICEVRFERELEQLIGEMPRVDEFIRAIEWIIARKRDAGKLVADEPYLIYGLVSALPGYPDVVVYYCVEDEYVSFLTMHVIGEAD